MAERTMRMNVVKEHFKSIDEMIRTIESRPNNEVMRNEHSSQATSMDYYQFTKTHTYDEAKKLYSFGYKEILPKIKKGFGQEVRKTAMIERRQVTTNVVGYAPHAPNAILGLPNSMILTKSQPQKTKALSICYCITQNCGTDADEFVRSGIAVLGVINSLELHGVRVKLRIAFYCANEDNEYAFGTVDVKHYREHLDLQKLCFPLAHPSMFRRIGFKWLETCHGLKNDWSCGYGSQLFDNNVIKKHLLEKDEVFLNLRITKKYDYDVSKIIDSLNLKQNAI